MPKQKTGLATIGAMLVFTSASLAEDRASRLISAFENWMSERDISAGTIAIIEETGVAAKGYGGQDPDAPVTLASLSKAVTGACIAVLQQEAVFDLTSDIADLTDILGAAGQLSDFLSHSSGLGPDRTQGQP